MLPPPIPEARKWSAGSLRPLMMTRPPVRSETWAVWAGSPWRLLPPAMSALQAWPSSPRRASESALPSFLLTGSGPFCKHWSTAVAGRPAPPADVSLYNNVEDTKRAKIFWASRKEHGSIQRERRINHAKRKALILTWVIKYVKLLFTIRAVRLFFNTLSISPSHKPEGQLLYLIVLFISEDLQVQLHLAEQSLAVLQVCTQLLLTARLLSSLQLRHVLQSHTRWTLKLFSPCTFKGSNRTVKVTASIWCTMTPLLT